MNIPVVNGTKGFTLIELMIVVGIIAITLTIGLPSFQQAIASNRLSTSVADMVGALQTARSESIKKVRFTGVVIKPDGKSWESVIISSPNEVIQSYNAAQNTTLVVSESLVKFRADGRVVAAAPITMTFTVDGSTEKRTITVQPSGTVSQAFTN